MYKSGARKFFERMKNKVRVMCVRDANNYSQRRRSEKIRSINYRVLCEVKHGSKKNEVDRD